MNNLKEFEKWCRTEHGCTDFSFEQHNYKFYCYNDEKVHLLFSGYQAATEAADAKWQARVRGLEDALQCILIVGYTSTTELLAREALSTTSPDQALQRALLDARIDEQERAVGMRAVESMRRVKELRKQLEEIGG